MQRSSIVVICILLVLVGCHGVVITDLASNSSVSYTSVAFNPKSNQTIRAIQNNLAGDLIYLNASICQNIEQDVTNKVVLFQDGQCEYITAVNNLINSQALAGLYFATVFREAGWFLTSDKKIMEVDYPLFEISREDALIIIANLTSLSSEDGFTTSNFSVSCFESVCQIENHSPSYYLIWYYNMIKLTILVPGVNYFRYESLASSVQSRRVLVLLAILLCYSWILYRLRTIQIYCNYPHPWSELSGWITWIRPADESNPHFGLPSSPLGN